MNRRSTKQIGLAALKLTILAATVGWIVMKSKEDWQTFVDQEKNWSLLGVAFLLVLFAHLVSYWRWQKLVIALQVPMRGAQAIRLGFLGTLFNQVSVGSVGGDFFKAIEAARNSNKKTEIVASVLVDRAMGLLGLLIVSSVGLIAAAELTPRLRAIKWAAIVLSVIGMAAVLLVGLLGEKMPIHWFRKIPAVGGTLQRLARACLVFQGRPRLIAEMLFSSLSVHTLFTFACFLISAALFYKHPTIVEHFSIIPPAMAAATLPLTPGGMGIQEMAIASLFKELPSLREGFSSVIMATTFRMLLISVSLIGAVYYFTGFGKRKNDQPDREVSTGDDKVDKLSSAPNLVKDDESSRT